MKITLVRNATNSRGIRIEWGTDGTCFAAHTCYNCEFIKDPLLYSCSALRKQLIATITPDYFPYTFNTDDYPEVFI